MERQVGYVWLGVGSMFWLLIDEGVGEEKIVRRGESLVLYSKEIVKGYVKTY
jgi:hypothetical protein